MMNNAGINLINHNILNEICNYKIYYSKILKVTEECVIYYVLGENNKQGIIKVLTSKDRIKRMQYEIEICKKIKEECNEFPCVVPRSSYLEGVYYQNYIIGKSYFEVKPTNIQKYEIANQLVRILEILKGISYKNIKNIDDTPWKERISNMIIKYINKIYSNKIIEKKDVQNVYDWIKDLFKSLEISDELSIVHNDLNKDNILIDKTKSKINIGIIDFERAIIADPLKDVSKLIWIFRKDNELGNIFWKLYCREMGSTNMDNLKLYWSIDILRHLSMYNQLNSINIWKKYLKEEVDILKNIVKDDYRLW
ncbi:aminoglycoside phosphotransferase family protein [Intestinibacter bartlettii]|uniref:aminoglycoside phosphotransferase family protein n=1 Tax=Intestinibacter bartlettii TaxID=261299 RepID=UPI0022E87ECC|nr:aminoglycoside phosphotransferase family protein [Intestinibacter bartlettii]